MKTTTLSAHRTSLVRASALVLSVLAVIACLHSSSVAQDRGLPSFQSGPYDFNFGLSAGYRSVTTANYGGNPSDYWDQQRYYEAQNFRNGININSLSLYGTRKGADGFFDELFLSAEGIGDPYTTASLRVRSFNTFDLKVEFHNNKYFMNRDDSIYTGLHKFDMSRQTINASLGIDATEDLKVELLYNSTGHTGNYTTTVLPWVDGGPEAQLATDSKGAPIYAGSFSSGSTFYWMNSPKNDQSNEYLLQATLTLPANSTVTLGGGFRKYTQDITLTPLNDTALTWFSDPNHVITNWSGVFAGFPNGAAYTDAKTFPLYSYTWNDHRVTNTPELYLSAVTKPMDKLSIAADIRYESASTDGSTVNGNLWEKSATAATNLGGPKTAGVRNVTDTVSATNNNTLKTLMGSLTLTAELTDELSLSALYRYTSTDAASDGSLYSNVGVTDTVTHTNYTGLYQGLSHTTVSDNATENVIKGFLNYTPMSSLNVRGGLQYGYRSPEHDRLDQFNLANGIPDSTENTAINAHLSRQITTVTPFVNFSYRPIHEVQINAAYEHSSMKATLHGTTTEVDLPIRILPQSNDKITAGIETSPVKGLRVNLMVGNTNGKSTFVDTIARTATATNIPTGADLKIKIMNVTGSVGYDITNHTSVMVSGAYQDYSLFTVSAFPRSQVNPNPIYGDSLAVLIGQNTIDRSLDASVLVNEIENLHILVGYSMIRSTGGTSITSDTKTGIAPDLVRVGGPFTWSLLHAQASYDITKNIGVMADYELTMQKEDGEQLSTTPLTNVLNNYKASLIRGSVYIHL